MRLQRVCPVTPCNLGSGLSRCWLGNSGAQTLNLGFFIVDMAKFSFERLRRLPGEPLYSNASHKVPIKKISSKFPHALLDFKITIIILYTCNLNPDDSQNHVRHVANDNYGRSKCCKGFKSPS